MSIYQYIPTLSCHISILHPSHNFKRVFHLRCGQLVSSYYLYLLRFSCHHLIFYEYQHYDYYYYCYGLLLSTCRIMTTVIYEISYTSRYLHLPLPPSLALSLRFAFTSAALLIQIFCAKVFSWILSAFDVSQLS